MEVMQMKIVVLKMPGFLEDTQAYFQDPLSCFTGRVGHITFAALWQGEDAQDKECGFTAAFLT